ncbi:hypothetical protein [Chitinophaga flava]|uniref:Uncharacterized protein n=1 Tax=Chitinophaga flava TaxID=2259036 RepID=A0A365Y435_9BACT|nr:hypothetical protein [Chitinophaga flava]RBL93343.1 hypothetical protein DF182_12520 [Chitinophaga flava]
MEKHPLQYFKDLITRNRIGNERINFINSQDYGTVINRDYKNGFIQYAVMDSLNEDSAAELITVTFIEHLESKINSEMFNVLDHIDNSLLSIDDEKKQGVYLKTIYKTLNSLILYAEQLEDLNQYIFIAYTLKDLKAELIDKYGIDDDAIAQKKINLPTSAQTSHKLQWMGKSKVLITLFYDLYSNVENGGEPLIRATKEQVKNFLLNNFIESDGQPLSPSSVDTILTPSKESKRALKGDRIDTSKLKEKK